VADNVSETLTFILIYLELHAEWNKGDIFVNTV